MTTPFLLLQTTRRDSGDLCYLFSPGANLDFVVATSWLKRANEAMNKNLESRGASFVAFGRDRPENGTEGASRLVREILLIGGIDAARLPQGFLQTSLKSRFAECWDAFRADPRLKSGAPIEHEQLGRWLATIVADSGMVPGKPKRSSRGVLWSIRSVLRWRIILVALVALVAAGLLYILLLSTSEPLPSKPPPKESRTDRPPTSIDGFAELCKLLDIPKQKRAEFRKELEKGGPAKIDMTDSLLEEATGEPKPFDPLRAFPQGGRPEELQDIVKVFDGANPSLDFKTCKAIRRYLHRWSIQIDSIRVATKSDVIEGASGPILSWLIHIPRETDVEGEAPVGPYFTKGDAQTAEVLKKWLQSQSSEGILSRYEIREGDWLQKLAQLNQNAGPGDALNEVKKLQKRPAEVIKTWSDLFEGRCEDRVLGCEAQFPFPIK